MFAPSKISKPSPNSIETLSDAIGARRLLWVFCRGCGHAARLDPRRLMIRAGERLLSDLQRKLICERCGARRAAVLPDDREWPGRD